MLEDLINKHNFSPFTWMMKELNTLLITIETQIKKLENNDFSVRVKTKFKRISDKFELIQKKREIRAYS